MLKKVRKPEAVRKSSDEDTIEEEEEEEAKLPLGGAPPVKLGRMSVDQPTMNMGGGRHAENAGSFFQVSRSIFLSSLSCRKLELTETSLTYFLQSIPSMIIANPTSNLLQPVASYPLARSLSTRDFPTSPSNSSSADHHEPLAGGWEIVPHKALASFSSAPPYSPARAGLRRLDEEPESEEGGEEYSEASNGTFGGR